uniref:Uncharacterized protein n=1 Tax=Caenorhabditis japonica TaxID=281687 RepID=A0A8R1E037_CAEJA
MTFSCRLHSYTCQLSEGGFCTLDKFSFPEDREGCTYLRPWSHKVDSWSFYFVLEKRPRKYGKAFAARQKLMKVKRQTSTKKEMSTEPFGILELYGVVPCSEVCGNEKDGKKLGSQADGTFHRGRSHRLQ